MQRVQAGGLSDTRHGGAQIVHQTGMSPLRGFSLAETLIVLAVAAILAGIAVPSFAALMRETRLTTVTNDLLSTLYFARSEAVKRNRRVTVCTSVTQDGCAENIGWQSGWIVFEDRDGDGQRSSTEQILVVAPRQELALTISGNLPVRDYVSYVPTGETRSRSGALQMGVVTACDSGTAKRIVIAATGRPRVVRQATC